MCSCGSLEFGYRTKRDTAFGYGPASRVRAPATSWVSKTWEAPSSALHPRLIVLKVLMHMGNSGSPPSHGANCRFDMVSWFRFTLRRVDERSLSFPTTCLCSVTVARYGICEKISGASRVECESLLTMDEAVWVRIPAEALFFMFEGLGPWSEMST